jgi:hypothetical protein
VKRTASISPGHRRGPSLKKRPWHRLSPVFMLALVLPFASMASSDARTTAMGGSDAHGLVGSRLYWSQFRDLDFSGARIVAAGVHGYHLRVLTHPAGGVVDVDPTVSPDGTRLLFERDRPDGSTKVGVVNANGSRERLLDLPCTGRCAALIGPTWTPDGKHVVYTRVLGPFNAVNDSASSAVLWRSALSGRHLVRLSARGIDGAFEDYGATFAPAGYVVFLRVRNADIKSAAFRMNADGSHVRRLTPWALDADELSVSPATSGPTRNLVVFETYGHGHPDGTSQAVATTSAVPPRGQRFAPIRFLTARHSLPVENFNPAWSPDGRRIAFVKFSFDESADPPVSGDIWRMRWDGAQKKKVSRSPLFDFRPTWGARPPESARM